MNGEGIHNNGMPSEFSESLLWMQSTMQRKAETLVLRTGERIRGIIFSENAGYLVFTPTGQRIFRFEDVVDREF
jgi:hypothetical protein